MHDITTLESLASKADTAFQVISNTVAGLNEEISSIEKDTSRSEPFKLEKIKGLRDTTAPVLGEQYEVLGDIFKEIGKQSKFWESKPLLLSQQKFSEDAGTDATIKANTGRELASLPVDVLKLVIEDAQSNNNLPMLYEAWLTTHTRSEECSRAGIAFDLEDIEIPGQGKALAAIAKAELYFREGETILIDGLGQRKSPESRLNRMGTLDDVRKRAAELQTGAR